MEQPCRATHKDVEKSTAAVGNFDQVIGSPEWLRALAEMLDSLGWKELARLAVSQTVPATTPRLSIEELEMWEAELLNQGFISPVADIRLSHLVFRQANLLRWRAARSGVEGGRLRFTVHVPVLLIARAAQIVAAVAVLPEHPDTRRAEEARSSAETVRRDMAELRYLEAIAARLTTAETAAPKSAYHRGLDLVLRVIGAGTRRSTHGPAEALMVELPVAMPQFVSSLRNYKKSLPKRAAA